MVFLQNKKIVEIEKVWLEQSYTKMTGISISIDTLARNIGALEEIKPVTDSNNPENKIVNKLV